MIELEFMSCLLETKANEHSLALSSIYLTPWQIIPGDDDGDTEGEKNEEGRNKEF